MSDESIEDSHDPCPWGERRTHRELYVKLFVVYFTIIGAWAHLMHLRREPRGIASFLLILICPVGGVALLVVPLLALTIQIVVCRGNSNDLKQSVGMLLGRLVPEHEADGAVPVEPVIQWPRPSSRLLGQLLVQFALLSQSVTLIWLFARLIQHGSDALYDYQIL